MTIDLKRSIDLRWLFDPVPLFIHRWSCFHKTNWIHSFIDKCDINNHSKAKQDRHPTSCHPSPFLAPPWPSPSAPWPSAPQTGSPPLFGLGKECRLLCRNSQRQPRSILRNLGNYFHEQMDKIKLKEDHGTHNNPLLTLLWTHSIVLGYVSKST